MSQKELQRIKVVENAVEGRLSVVAAAELLQLSDRQVKRLKQNYDDADPNWVHHGNWGRQPANAIPQDTRSQVIELATGRYAGFNDSHLHEKLLQAEGLVLSRPSVQRILRQAGIRSPQKRRSPKYHSRRERRAQEGMLLQVDGSRHDWLEGRGLPLTLLFDPQCRPFSVLSSTATIPVVALRAAEVGPLELSDASQKPHPRTSAKCASKQIGCCVA